MITVVHVGSNSINPSYTVLYDELVRLRTPQLRVVDVSDVTIEALALLCRESDAVAFDNFIKVADKLDPASPSSVILHRWRGADFYRSAWQAVAESPAPLLYVASGWDLHWPGPELTEILERANALAWMFEKKPLTLDEVPPAHRDPWMAEHADPLANWRRVREKVPVRIELIHSLGRDELARGPRRAWWEACIAGMPYATRRLAEESARHQGVELAPFRRFDGAILGGTDLLSHAIPAATALRFRNHLRRADQRLLVSRSRVNFVCGSGYRYPVRKYFEVAAAGSALVCDRCTGFEDYGFRDGVSAVLTDPEDFGPSARRLLADEPRRATIARSGLDVVRRLHGATRRAADLLTCLDRLARGQLTSAQFLGGEFVIA